VSVHHIDIEDLSLLAQFESLRSPTYDRAYVHNDTYTSVLVL
jgi:hypothetical protein